LIIFLKFHLTSLLGINATVGREIIFKPSIWNESLHEDSNDNDVRIVNFELKKSICQEHDIPTPKHSYVHLDLP